MKTRGIFPASYLRVGTNFMFVDDETETICEVLAYKQHSYRGTLSLIYWDTRLNARKDVTVELDDLVEVMR